MPTATADPAQLAHDPAAIAELGAAICAGYELPASQARVLLDIEPGSPAQAALFAAAQAVRARFLGERVKCCSILNVKAGNCSENCSYCAQASGSTATGYDKTKWLPDEDIVVAADSAAANGAGALGLVAAWRGVKEGAQLDMVCKAVERLASQGAVRADVTLGILESQHCADRLAEAGAKVYCHNLETARSFFDQVCTSHSFADRMRTIGYIRKAGMGLCSGGIIGMGESKDQRIEFAEQVRYLAPDMVPINFLNPIAGTGLGQRQPMPADEALTTLATFRLMLPRLNLLAAGGKEVVLGDRLHEVFSAGVNAIMVGNYLTSLGTAPAYWRAAAARHGLALAGEDAPEDACGCHSQRADRA
jgi:biotin synthase